CARRYYSHYVPAMDYW
nr:immunoglobulin heavy chain junction region [Mus musculus]